MGSVGTSQNNTARDTYTRPGEKTVYSVVLNDKDNKYYLKADTPMSNGETLHERYRISYANDDNKAQIYIKELRQVVKLNDDPNILRLLQNKRKGK